MNELLFQFPDSEKFTGKKQFLSFLCLPFCWLKFHLFRFVYLIILDKGLFFDSLIFSLHSIDLVSLPTSLCLFHTLLLWLAAIPLWDLSL